MIRAGKEYDKRKVAEPVAAEKPLGIGDKVRTPLGYVGVIVQQSATESLVRSEDAPTHKIHQACLTAELVRVEATE